LPKNNELKFDIKGQRKCGIQYYSTMYKMANDHKAQHIKRKCSFHKITKYLQYSQYFNYDIEKTMLKRILQTLRFGTHYIIDSTNCFAHKTDELKYSVDYYTRLQ